MSILFRPKRIPHIHVYVSYTLGKTLWFSLTKVEWLSGPKEDHWWANTKGSWAK